MVLSPPLTDVGTRHGTGTGLTLHWHSPLASHRSPMLPCRSHWHWSPVAPGSGGVTRGRQQLGGDPNPNREHRVVPSPGHSPRHGSPRSGSPT